MRPVVLAAATLLAVPALAADRTYDFTDFDSVDVSEGIETRIVVGQPWKVEAEALRGNIDRLSITQRRGTLIIERDPQLRLSLLQPNDRFAVWLSMPSLSSVEASSAAEVEVSGEISGNLRVSTSSGAEIELRGVSARRVSVSASSGSEVSAGGSCERLDVDLSSGAEVDAGRLVCGVVNVDASSGAEAEVTATGSFSGDASSGGNVEVGGTPGDRSIETSSGGDISFRD